MLPTKQVLCIALAASFLLGCAIPGAVLQVPVEKPSVQPTKQAVMIVSVRDERQFVIDPATPSRPSLEGNAIENKMLAARTLGRKRGMFGQAGGNLFLPEGQSVAGLTEQFLAAALAEKGYRVVAKGADGPETVLTLSAIIRKFWGWSNPGAKAKISFEAQIELTGPWPMTKEARVFDAHASYSYHAVTNDDWRQMFRKGVSDLQHDVAESLN